MKSMIEASIRFRGLIIAAGAGLMILGATQLVSAPVDALPEFKPTIVEVQTEALGLSAEEVEQLITVPLEQDLLNGVAFLQDIESVSLPGLSSIVLTFEPGTDILDARQVVAERLTQAVGVAGLPAVGKTPQMLQPLSSTNRVAIVRLSPGELTAIQTSVLARWVIGPRLLGVEGVANVGIWGQRERQLQVLVDPVRLQAAGVTLNQIIRTTGNALEVSPLTFLEASAPGTGGFVDTANQRLQVFHEQAIKNPEQLEKVPIEDEDGNAVFVNGAALTLGEVADVVEDHQPLIGDALCSDGECQLLVIEKFPGANTRAVAEGIEDALAALRPGLAGVDMDSSIYRPAEYIESSIANTRLAAVVGALLAIVVLAAFLLNWRSVLVTTVAMAGSLAVAATVLVVRGETLNLMILAGLVIGLIVVIDDVVFDVDRLAGRMRVGDDEGHVPVARRVEAALTGTRSAMLYAAVILVAATIPVFFMDGVAGAFLPPVLASYLLAVGASMIVALTLTPALASLVIDGTSPSRPVRATHRFYDERVAPLVTRPATAVLAFAVVAALGALSVVLLRPSLDPALRERDVIIDIEAAQGTSLPLMTEMTGELVQAVAELPGVRTVGAHVGRAVMSDQVVNVNESEVWINLDPAASYDDTLAAINGVARSNPALSALVTTHSAQRVDDILQRTEDDIVVRVYGESRTVLAEKSAEVQQLMARIDGIADVRVETPSLEETIQVTVDLGPAQAVGLKPGDVRRTAAVLLNGLTVGNLFDEQKVFDVVVWGVPALRESFATVGELPIETDSFGLVSLDSVAEVAIVAGRSEIRRESVSTYIDVTATVEGRSVSAVAGDVEAAVGLVAFPLEHRATLLGGFDERRSQNRLIVALWIGVAALVLLLLQAAFNSWRLAVAALVASAMAVGGGLVAIWLTNGSVTLGAAAGLFVVFGFGVRRSVGAIQYFQRLRRDEGLPFGSDLVVRGTRDQLAPTVATTLMATALLLPFALQARALGFEILQPMAVTVIGGLIATALMVVVVIPAMYMRFGEAEIDIAAGDELFDLSLTDIEDETAVGAER